MVGREASNKIGVQDLLCIAREAAGTGSAVPSGAAARHVQHREAGSLVSVVYVFGTRDVTLPMLVFPV